MKKHTIEFKENIKLLGKQQESKIVYGKTELSSNVLNSVTPKVESSILKSAMKELIIDSNVEIPLKTILTYFYGLKTSKGYEYLNFGNYIVKSVEKKEDTKSYLIKCYDKMLYTMKDYEALDIIYPCTIKDFIIALCTKLKIQFANRNETFTNYNKILEKDLYTGINYTYRDVLDDIAEVTASTICINDKDELEIRYINDTKDTIDEEYLNSTNINFGEKYGKINSIVLSRSAESDNIYKKDEESIANNGLCEIKIKDNQIMNLNNRGDYLQGIFDRLNGLEFYLNDFVSTGIVYYDICDRYNIKILNKTYSCIMFNDEINITQGLSENIYTKAPKQEQTEYKKADTTDKKLNQAYIIVDKQKQEIESLASNVSTNKNEIKELQSKVTQNSQSVNVAISELTEKVNTNSDNLKNSVDNINKTLENGVETLKNTLVKIDINGITVSTNLSTISTTMTNKEFAIKTKSGQTLAFFGYDEKVGKTIAQMDNLTITNYFTAGYHRVEKMENGKTGWFYVRSDI